MKRTQWKHCCPFSFIIFFLYFFPYTLYFRSLFPFSSYFLSPLYYPSSSSPVCFFLSFSSAFSLFSPFLPCRETNSLWSCFAALHTFSISAAVTNFEILCFFRWESQDMESAINDVMEKGISIRKAASAHGIPKSSLADRITRRRSKGGMIKKLQDIYTACK